MMPAADWVAAKLPSAPAALRDIMVKAVELNAGEGSDSAEALSRAALALYQDVIASPGARDDALILLAADALLTHAFELQADADPGGLTAFAGRFGGRGEIGLLGDHAMGRSR